MQTELLTNGVLINRQNSSKLTSAFDAVTISLDSHLETIHDMQRGHGTFQKVIEALSILRDHNTRNINLSIVITKTTVKTVSQYLRFALEHLKVDNVVTQLCLPYNQEELECMERLIPAPEDILWVDNQIDHYYTNRPTKQGQQPLYRTVTCGAGTGEISVDPNGDVFPCHTLHKQEFLCGNLRNQSVRDIFENSAIIKFFKELTVNKIETCSHCDVRHVCGGGCRALAYSMTGRIDGFNSFSCDYLRQKSIRKLWASSDYHPEITTPNNTAKKKIKTQQEEI
jgi:AdoMet-dependent heme synthase